jgi:hypothetical protein
MRPFEVTYLAPPGMDMMRPCEVTYLAPPGMEPASLKAIKLARSIRQNALVADPISMFYDEVKATLNATELAEIATGIELATVRRNEAETIIINLLHVLASRDPHATLVHEKLATGEHIFETACEFLGVDMTIEGVLPNG